MCVCLPIGMCVCACVCLHTYSMTDTWWCSGDNFQEFVFSLYILKQSLSCFCWYSDLQPSGLFYCYFLLSPYRNAEITDAGHNRRNAKIVDASHHSRDAEIANTGHIEGILRLQMLVTIAGMLRLQMPATIAGMLRVQMLVTMSSFSLGFQELTWVARLVHLVLLCAKPIYWFSFSITRFPLPSLPREKEGHSVSFWTWWYPQICMLDIIYSL